MTLIAILFTIILILITFVIGFVVFLSLWLAAVCLTRRRRKVLWGVASLPAYTVCYIALVVGLYLYSSSPSQVFANTLGFPPSAQVTDLQTDLYSFGDNSEAYLYFKADRATVDRIVQRGMMAVLPPPAGHVNVNGTLMNIGSAQHPAWYQPSTAPSREVYSATGLVQRHTSENETLTYDPGTGEVWFHYEGID